MRVLVAAVVGGVLLFLWGFVAHVLLPFSEKAMKPIPNEAAVIEAVRGNVTESGVYFIPYLNYMKASPQEQQAYADKIASGPSGLLVLRTGGVSMDMKRELPMEFISNFLAALVAALAVDRPGRAYLRRPRRHDLRLRCGRMAVDLGVAMDLVRLQHRFSDQRSGRPVGRLAAGRAGNGRGAQAQEVSCLVRVWPAAPS